MSYKLKYRQYNEHSILIEWPPIIDENILNNILGFKKLILKKYTKLKVEVINTYNSILIIYNKGIDNINDEISVFKTINESCSLVETPSSPIWEIPVCYDDEVAMDLERFSKEKNLSKQHIIELHSTSVYTVFFIGFLPGFLYLGGLNPKLFLDRKSTPSLHVKKGAVAIGGQQTGIYPQDSPGGWHIIGNTPVELFNSLNEKPMLISAGDKVKFKPIDKQEYFDIKQWVSASSYQLHQITSDA